MLQGGPGRTLEQGDSRAFNGSLAARERLLGRRGLTRTLPRADGAHGAPARYETLPLYEAVIAESSNLVGTPPAAANLREQYQRVVPGIQRHADPRTSQLGAAEPHAGARLAGEARLLLAWAALDHDLTVRQIRAVASGVNNGTTVEEALAGEGYRLGELTIDIDTDAYCKLRRRAALDATDPSSVVTESLESTLGDGS